MDASNEFPYCYELDYDSDDEVYYCIDCDTGYILKNGACVGCGQAIEG